MKLIKGKLYHFKNKAFPDGAAGKTSYYGEYIEEKRGFYLFKVKRIKSILFVKKEDLELL